MLADVHGPDFRSDFAGACVIRRPSHDYLSPGRIKRDIVHLVREVSRKIPVVDEPEQARFGV
jgi:hypothetical protein